MALRYVGTEASKMRRNSYTKNSSYQRGVIDAAKLHIQSAIAKKLQPENFATLDAFSIADLGCSVGPNTFFSVQNILEAVKLKYKIHESNTRILEFQVFFNDHSMNDFNTLFKYLPPYREFCASGVPGSFYSRLLLRASLHFVHSSYSLHWLSQVPKEVTNRKEEITKAYLSQHAMDMANFLSARAEEVVPGGLMTIVVPGLIDEEKVDSFNIPAYCTRPQELEAVIQKNECFTIESIEFALSDGTGHSPWAPRCIFQHKSHYSGINKGTFWW
ncbi:probable S-adenosylmethionine-dependent methyltransferase At5g38100 [Olea europaea subsp. europaea]|uniref:Probable S-adenosylmethionine-dependent methyltransferase At5g38100 n=1 Tax=Olea europaea subsp. europaea TaxID=158383 RepID=A0A8S0UWY1_OLEEU|nr:probable S-adenosylmethionine-dependent methyltransferase At5g38100 [Olea europaea subsp. europaea]